MVSSAVLYIPLTVYAHMYTYTNYCLLHYNIAPSLHRTLNSAQFAFTTQGPCTPAPAPLCSMRGSAYIQPPQKAVPRIMIA